MEALKDIFVPYDIAVQLKEIGFDESCIAYYDDRYWLYMWHNIMTKKVNVEEELSICNFNESNPYHNIISAPTWEQIFKWFRKKGGYCTIVPEHLCTSYFFEVIIDEGGNDEIICKYSGFKTYEQAREQLILKLIEIYKNGKQNI